MAAFPDSRLRRILIALAFSLLASVAAAQSSEAMRVYRSGRLAEAETLSRAALKASPGDVDASVVLGWCLLDKGSWEEAYLAAEKARGFQRYDPRLVEILGRAALGLGLNDESLKYFQEFLNLLPEGASVGGAYANMGEIYIRQGRYQHADIALTTAVTHSPADAGLWSRLGYAREKAKDYGHSREAYEQSLRLSPAFQDARLGLERVEALLSGRQ